MYEHVGLTLDNFPNSGDKNLIKSVVFTPDLVEGKLKTLDDNIGAGVDGYPSYSTKHCATVLWVPLSILFNKSMHPKFFLLCERGNF